MRRGLLLALVGTVALAAGSLSAASVRPSLKPGVVAEVVTAVGRVQARSCRGRWTRSGTGFLVGHSVVMTARHVLTGACSYTVILGGRSYEGSRPLFWYTAGTRDENQADIATLRLSSAARGRVLSFARRTPKPGTTMAVLGFPLGRPLRLHQGPLVGSAHAWGVPILEVGIPTARGSSGSAFLDPDGDVVGILQRSIVPPTAGRVFGIDLVRWWGTDIVRDLCGAYPRGGIPGCAAVSGAS